MQASRGLGVGVLLLVALVLAQSVVGQPPVSGSPAAAQSVRQPAQAAPSIEDIKPTAFTRAVLPLEMVEQVQPPPIDLEAVRNEDAIEEAEGLAPRFAIPHPVYLIPASNGTWEELDRNTMLWRMRITSPGAVSINLGFTQYSMPAGGRLFVYAADGSFVIRPFTAADNAAHGELWTPVCMSDDIVVEVTLPPAEVPALVLELGSINHGYRGFRGLLSNEMDDDGGPRSGSCNIDVVCPQGIPWQLDIPAVAVISTGGSRFCTGFMVNNTANDLRPFFMTAKHCGVTSGNAASLVTYWNYYNSWCRPQGSPQSGGPGDGSLAQFNTGSFFRSEYTPSDFTLVELSSNPNPAWNISYAGWDRTGANPPSGVCIHHPNTDEKRITRYDVANRPDRPTHGSSWGCSAFPGPGDNTHIKVYWHLEGAVTEPGSSGSPLFDNNHRVVGQLHGGASACGATGDSLSDCYGRISTSWTGGGTNSTRLSNWLDQAGTGATFVNTVSLATLCSHAGTVALDRPKYACDGLVNITVVDCGLNTNDNVIETVTITVRSTTEPGGESVVLTETQANSARFKGSVALSTTNSSGVVQVTAGDTVTATYVDADNGQGQYNVVVTATAVVDCTPPVISNVQIVNVQARSATISFNANEPVQGAILYGLSCASLPGKAMSTGYSTAVTIEVTGLQDNTPYYFVVNGEDEAGNSATDNNGGVCYSFTTPEIPDFYTEIFTASDNDLDNLGLKFTPNSSPDFYAGCAEPITSLPTDPAGGTPITSWTGSADDGYAQVSLSGGQTVKLYGQSYGTFYVGTNGYITFNTGDSTYTESLAAHFNRPRISALFDDLNVTGSAAVSWKQLADRAVVTWLTIPEYSNTGSNTFQIEMFYDGTITINYLACSAADGLAGLSAGTGQDPGFTESDLSTLGACGPKPPTAQNVTASTPVSTPKTVTLSAQDDGLPNPPGVLSYIISQLPARGSLSDPGAGPITAAPYTLVNNGKQVVYQPEINYRPSDTFKFKANDGGTAPAGGDSNEATATISIGGSAWDPVAYNVNASTAVSAAKDITLNATDPNGDPLTYVIKSLPASGFLSDPGAGPIQSVPYQLAGGGKVVTYQPPCGEVVVNSFTYTAKDLTAESNIATVTASVTPGAAQLVLNFPMDSDPGWSIQGLWAFGRPTGGGTHNKDPNNGHTGTNVYGYNLTGNYTNNLAVQYLTTTAIDCTNLTNTELRFRRWLGVEGYWGPGVGDRASIQVSNNGSDWTTVWQNGIEAVSEAAWSLQTYNVSAVADHYATVYLRWGMGPTDSGVTYPGWNIDDVEIWGVVTWIPVEAGDVNLDGTVNGADIGPFVKVLLDPASATTRERCAADVEENGVINLGDLDVFVQRLLQP